MKINKNWQPKEFPTGLINPATGKEWVLSDYYVDKQGNKYFTHDEALKIWDSLPGWGPCTDGFHQALKKLVWDEETDYWRKNVNGSGLSGLEHMIKKLKYEGGGYRDCDDGELCAVGHGGYIWSSSFAGEDANYLYFSNTSICSRETACRVDGHQLRLLKEK